jgi:hypothetical protein
MSRQAIRSAWVAAPAGPQDRTFTPKFIFDLSSGELKNTSLVMNHGIYEAASSTRSYHIVRRGDTLTGIAARQGTTVRELCRLNGLSTRSTLRIGQRVRTR